MFQPIKYTDKRLAYLEEDVIFNILFVGNISMSLQSQIDHWLEYDDPINVSVDRIRKAKKTGQKVITEVDVDKFDSKSFGSPIYFGDDILKLTLRDQNQNLCYGYEFQSSLPFLRERKEDTGTPMCIPLGGRLLVQKGTSIRYGALILTKNNCKYLGIHEQDKELYELLNSGIVKKYIEVLRDELNASCAT